VELSEEDTMRFFRLCSLTFLFLTLSSNYIHAEKLTIYTEEFPPYNFTENKKITGVSTEVVEAVMKKTGFEYKIESYPWVRAYEISQIKPNSLIFSISRRVKRESLFKWIGIIVPSVHSVFALKERTDIKVEKLEDLKKYEIGTTIEDARETYLIKKGFEIDKLQRIGGDTAYMQNYKKLKTKRIDLLPMPDAVMNYIVSKAGDHNSKVLRKVFELSEISTGGYYIAASLQTTDEVVNKIRATLEDFKKTPGYKMILEKWGL
jgi:polar amino acid transport system substrate-binding protein